VRADLCRLSRESIVPVSDDLCEDCPLFRGELDEHRVVGERGLDVTRELDKAPVLLL